MPFMHSWQRMLLAQHTESAQQYWSSWILAAASRYQHSYQQQRWAHCVLRLPFLEVLSDLVFGLRPTVSAITLCMAMALHRSYKTCTASVRLTHQLSFPLAAASVTGLAHDSS